MEQKEIKEFIKKSNESEIRNNALYGTVFKDIISKAANDSR